MILAAAEADSPVVDVDQVCQVTRTVEPHTHCFSRIAAAPGNIFSPGDRAESFTAIAWAVLALDWRHV